MSQASKRLQDIFMAGNSDGILKASRVIVDASGSVDNGVIKTSSWRQPDTVIDAIDFLIEEWEFEWHINEYVSKEKEK